MTNFKLPKTCICLLNILLISFGALTVSSCDRQSDYSSDPKTTNIAGRKIKLKKQDQVWERVRKNFDMAQQSKQNAQHNRVQHYVKQYAGAHQQLDKASPYMYYIIEQIEKRDMPGELALLPMVESAFQPQATSHKSAAGLWQFIPSTGRHFGLKQDQYYDGRRDVTASTKAALDYLAILHKQFDNNWMLALAAYNAGEGTIQRAIQKNKRKGKSTHFWDLDLPRETKEYVPKLLAIAEVVNHPEKHNISLPPIANKPYFESVTFSKTVDLNKVAKLADVEMQEMKLLNAGYRKTHTHPTNGTQQLLLPADKADALKNNLGDMIALAPAMITSEPEKATTAKKSVGRKKSSKKKAGVRAKKGKSTVKHAVKGKKAKGKSVGKRKKH